MNNNMWPTSQAGKLKFIIDLYFDDTLTEDEKREIISKEGLFYLDFYNFLKTQHNKEYNLIRKIK